MVFFSKLLDEGDVLIARSVAQIALGHIAGIEYALSGEQTKALEHGVLVLVHVECDGGLRLVEVR